MKKLEAQLNQCNWRDKHLLKQFHALGADVPESSLSDLKQLYADLDLLEQDLKRTGEDLTEVREHKAQVWADMAARNLVAGPEEQLFYKINRALTCGELAALCLTIPDVSKDQETANELLHAVEQRKEQFAARARAIQNN